MNWIRTVLSKAQADVSCSNSHATETQVKHHLTTLTSSSSQDNRFVRLNSYKTPSESDVDSCAEATEDEEEDEDSRETKSRISDDDGASPAPAVSPPVSPDEGYPDSPPVNQGNLASPCSPSPPGINIVGNFSRTHIKGGKNGVILENGSLSTLYHHKKYLGLGAFGLVLGGQHYLDEARCAVKVIAFDPKELTSVLKEVRPLAQLSTHRNVVSYKGCWIEETSAAPSGLMDKLRILSKGEPVPGYVLCIKMERCAANLRKFLEARNKAFFRKDDFVSKDALKALRDGRCFNDGRHRAHGSIFRDIVSGLMFLHKRKIMHRDLKPENILVDGDTKDYKISDFGLARMFDDEASRVSMTKGVGTAIYAAPEQISSKQYGLPADVFPLGLILLELMWPLKQTECLGQLLRDARHKKQLPEYLFVRHPRISNYISLMLDDEPSGRPVLDDLLHATRTMF